MRLLSAASALALSISLASTPAWGLQWIEGGDPQLQEDIERLHDAGVVPGPILSWPIPVDQIGPALDGANQDANLSPELKGAIARVIEKLERPHDAWPPSTETTLQLTNDPSLFRSFADTARSDYDARVRFEHHFDNTSIIWGIGRRSSQLRQTSKFSFDSLYIAQRIGNWMVYGGTVDKWWGPGSQGSLLISNSARPFPKVGITRVVPFPFKSKWFSWMGPWRLETWVGLQNGPRTDVQNPLLVGTRLELQLSPRFEMALSRITQICGSGRPCNASAFQKSFVSFTGSNPGNNSDPANAGAGMEFRYHRPIGNKQLSAFAQFYAEDSVFESIAQYYGLSLTGHNARWGSWKVGAEYADTYAYRLFNPPGRQPRSTYLNFIYNDGLSYRGKPIGYSTDGDSKAISIFGSLTDKRNIRWSSALRYVDYNQSRDARYHITQTREKIFFGEGRVDLPTVWGDIGLMLRVQSDSPNTPNSRKARVQVEMGWRRRF